MAGVERRRWTRLERDLRVELKVIGPEASRSIDAIGTHLSPEGIFVQLADPPSTDTQVQVTIGGEDNSAFRVSAKGVVINQLPPNEESTVSGACIELKDAGPAWLKLYQMLSKSPD